MAEHDGSARGAGDNPLRRIAEYFETVGWNKRLVDLTEDEVVGLIFIAKKTEGLEDVYTEPYLAELFDRIVQNSVKPEPATIPF
jgi:hypothetical protein